jgi:hypothetical protein
VRTALLWLHVISGVVWIAASAATAIARQVLSVGSIEFRDFVRTAMPTLNRTNLGAAICLFVTGAVNLMMLGLPISFRFPATFTTVLSVKIALFAAMAIGLAVALRAEKPLIATLDRDDRSSGVEFAKIGNLSTAVAALGALALTLGLWLMGSL